MARWCGDSSLTWPSKGRHRTRSGSAGQNGAGAPTSARGRSAAASTGWPASTAASPGGADRRRVALSERQPEHRAWIGPGPGWERNRAGCRCRSPCRCRPPRRACPRPRCWRRRPREGSRRVGRRRDWGPGRPGPTPTQGRAAPSAPPRSHTDTWTPLRLARPPGLPWLAPGCKRPRRIAGKSGVLRCEAPLLTVMSCGWWSIRGLLAAAERTARGTTGGVIQARRLSSLLVPGLPDGDRGKTLVID